MSSQRDFDDFDFRDRVLTVIVLAFWAAVILIPMAVAIGFAWELFRSAQ